MPEITIDSVTCDGCLGTDSGRLGSCCLECEIRACGVARGVVNCARRADYACKKLAGFLEQSPEARAVLDEIRHTL